MATVKKQTGELGVTGTFLDGLVAALRRAGQYNRNDQVPPAAVLWPDKERQWEPLLHQLRLRLPLLTLGAYNPGERTGPAYWLRCMLAGSLEDKLPEDQVPIIYLPGYSKHEIRAVEDCPRELQPLAELQYRGALWVHKNGKDWTVPAFLQSPEGGLSVEVGSDQATREALQQALPLLAGEQVAKLRQEAPLKAAFFYHLLTPDETRAILRWLNQPKEYQQQATPSQWSAFRELCKSKYGFQPEKDGPIYAAGLLGKMEGAWAGVWSRFTEAPTNYPGLPALLDKAASQYLYPEKVKQPGSVQLSMFEESEAWPQHNRAAEDRLRSALQTLGSKQPAEVRPELSRLAHEDNHLRRQNWVWASYGQAPLAFALSHLLELASLTLTVIPMGSVAEITNYYLNQGHKTDYCVLEALARVEDSQDAVAVKAVVNALYRPWLEQAAKAMQKAIGGPQDYQAGQLPAVEAGTCVLFSDGLRLDLGDQLRNGLLTRNLKVQFKTHLAALPTITSTAKPAVSPVAHLITGEGKEKLEPGTKSSGSTINITVLQKLLESEGVQILKGDETGDPGGKAWTEAGNIDEVGHIHGWKMAHHIKAELRGLEQRIENLLKSGWQKVIVVTDHGWLMLPGGLPKAELPEHLTVTRKGRCARLKNFVQDTGQQVLPWRWDKTAPIAFAPGICCYEAGKEYEHGGLSPQECVTPLLIVTGSEAAARPIKIETVSWRGLRCLVKVSSGSPDIRLDIRSKANDPDSSLVAKPGSPGADGTLSALVEDEDNEGKAVFAVILGADGTVLFQVMTSIGGDQ